MDLFCFEFYYNSDDIIEEYIRFDYEYTLYNLMSIKITLPIICIGFNISETNSRYRFYKVFKELKGSWAVQRRFHPKICWFERRVPNYPLILPDAKKMWARLIWTRPRIQPLFEYTRESRPPENEWAIHCPTSTNI